MKLVKFLLLALIGVYSLNAQLVPNNPPPKVVLAWDASQSAGITNYNIYYGSSSGYYTNKISVGLDTSAMIDTGLIRGVTYYFAVTAQDDFGLESNFSIELVKNIRSIPLSPENLRELEYDPFAQAVYGNSVENQLYAVERTSDFDSWVIIGDVISDDAGDFYILDDNPPLKKGFYRLITKG